MGDLRGEINDSRRKIKQVISVESEREGGS